MRTRSSSCCCWGAWPRRIRRASSTSTSIARRHARAELRVKVAPGDVTEPLRPARRCAAERRRCREVARGRAVRRALDRDRRAMASRAATAPPVLATADEQVRRRRVDRDVPDGSRRDLDFTRVLRGRPASRGDRALVAPGGEPIRDRARATRRHAACCATRRRCSRGCATGMDHIYERPRSHLLRARAAARRDAVRDSADWQAARARRRRCARPRP